MTYDTPHGSPIDIQAVTTRWTAPAAIIISPSVHLSLRESVSPVRRWRRISRTSAIGVRVNRQPPATTWSPSFTRVAASSRLVSLSPADFALASSRRRAATKSYSIGFR
jgi:hypothetical protein